MMVVYPVFLYESGDLTIEMFSSFDQLRGWYERIDVAEGLFRGWDATGVRIALSWNYEKNVEELNVHDSVNRIDELKAAIVRSVEILTGKPAAADDVDVVTDSPEGLFVRSSAQG